MPRYLTPTQLGEVRALAAAPPLPRRRPRRAARVRPFPSTGRHHRRPATPRPAPRPVPRTARPDVDVLFRALVGLERLAVAA